MFFLCTPLGSRHRYDVIVNLHWTRPLAELDLVRAASYNATAAQCICASQRSSDGGGGHRFVLIASSCATPIAPTSMLNELREVPGVSRVTSLKAQEESEL